MAWAGAALDRLPPACMPHLTPLTKAVAMGAELRVSTAFSGIDAPMVSLGMIATALKTFPNAQADLPQGEEACGLRITNLFAVENNPSCQEELLNSPHGPGCCRCQMHAGPMPRCQIG